MDLEDLYQYSPITEQRTIRLMVIQPSQELEASIQCSLFLVGLEEADCDIAEPTSHSHMRGETQITSA
jgi:hypothetical protein